MISPPPTSTLFPYTTLFRSDSASNGAATGPRRARTRCTSSSARVTDGEIRISSILESPTTTFPPHARHPLLHPRPPPGPRHGARLRRAGRETVRTPVRPREPLPLGQREADGRARPVRHPLAGRARRRRDGLPLLHHCHPRARQGRR